MNFAEESDAGKREIRFSERQGLTDIGLKYCGTDEKTGGKEKKNINQ